MHLKGQKSKNRQNAKSGSDGKKSFKKRVWTERDLNPRPLPCEGNDLPADLSALKE